MGFRVQNNHREQRTDRTEDPLQRRMIRCRRRINVRLESLTYDAGRALALGWDWKQAGECGAEKCRLKAELQHSRSPGFFFQGCREATFVFTAKLSKSNGC